MLRHSLSFLQVAKSVSEVANSRYQSLFFILGGEGGARRGGDMGTCGGGGRRDAAWGQHPPAVKLLRVFLPHDVEAVRNGGILWVGGGEMGTECGGVKPGHAGPPSNQQPPPQPYTPPRWRSSC